MCAENAGDGQLEATGPTPGLLIVWHSRTRGSEQLARAAHDGAHHALHELQSDRSVRLLGAADAGPPDLLDAAAYLFVCPENLAAMSGQMKEFFDRCYYPVLGRLDGRPYASIICAGSDGQSAQAQIARIATGWRLRCVARSLIVCTEAQTPAQILAVKTIAPASLAAAADMGGRLAAGLALGID